MVKLSFVYDPEKHRTRDDPLLPKPEEELKEEAKNVQEVPVPA